MAAIEGMTIMKSMLSVITLALMCGLPFLGVAREAPFLRGDVSQNGKLGLDDALFTFRFLFAEVPFHIGCLEAADVNDDGRVNVADAIGLLNYLYLHGARPSPPFPQVDLDPTPDDLGCDVTSDTIIFVADRSGSMQDQGELAIARREIVKNIQQFNPTRLFAVIFVDKGVLAYPADATLAYAVPNARTEALSFVQNTPGGSGSCVKDGLLAALDLTDQAESQRKVIVFFSDGGTDCPGQDATAYGQETLDEVTARNTQGVHINTIGIGPEVADEFLKQLAAQNHGAYVRIVQ
jgi:Mg-chelatase subunit ChlD